jgi:hypothetical protein
LLPVARNPDVNKLIAADFKASGLGKREVARRVWGDEEKYRDLGRYVNGRVTPGPSLAVALAAALGQAETRYLARTPLAAVARELAEASRLAETTLARLEVLERAVTEGFEESLGALRSLAADVGELARRLPPEAEPKRHAR